MIDYNTSSRLNRKRIKQAYLKFFLATLVSLALIISIFYLGIPGLIKLSSLITNLRSTNDPVTTSDTTPPFPPRLEPISEATNTADLTVKGFSEPSSVVEIFLNGETIDKQVTTKDGAFQADVFLSQGENRILAQATDNAKNVSQPSATLFVNFRKEGPKLEISQPRNEDTITSDNRMIEIQGITNPDVSVTINDRFIIVNQDGSFIYPYSLANGDNLIKISAVDDAGNKTIVERKVKYSP